MVQLQYHEAHPVHDPVSQPVLEPATRLKWYYLARIICLVLAPTPFVASIFMTFGHLVGRLGEQYSWISAKTCASVFFSIFDKILTRTGRDVQTADSS